VAGATSQSQSERRDGDGDGSDDYELPAHVARYVPPDDAEVGAGAIPETAGTGVSRRPSGSAESRASAAARPVVPSAVADDPSEVRRAPLNEQRAKEGKQTNAYWTQRWPNVSGSPGWLQVRRLRAELEAMAGVEMELWRAALVAVGMGRSAGVADAAGGGEGEGEGAGNGTVVAAVLLEELKDKLDRCRRRLRAVRARVPADDPA
jgi:hypothetical protein